MAAYKYASNFKRLTGGAFDIALTPGTIIKHSGIYKCTGCGDEVAANKGDPLPPQNRHQHKNRMIPVRWKLIVAAQQVA